MRFLAALAIATSLLAVTATVSAQDEVAPIATDEFHEVWERADLSVAEGVTERPWVWGPGGYSELLLEEYVDAEGGEREVQYFDTARMEMTLTDPDDPDSPPSVSFGLLAMELMTGRLQIGDDTREQHPPAMVPVAGDRNDVTGPTYAAMGRLTGFEFDPTNRVITSVVGRNGGVTSDRSLAMYGVFPIHHDSVTNQNVASVFWVFMTSDDEIVYEDGSFEEGELFPVPHYAVGRPVTEAYWAWVKVGGVHQWVLIQCFERRCLTYTPDNPAGFRVESSNVGRHYYHWRYNLIDREAQDEQEESGFRSESQPGPSM